jgi:hypothetical protein
MTGASEVDRTTIHRPTLIAIALVSYMIADIVHEALGHGGACLLSGGRAVALSTVHFECSFDTRFISAAGTLANFVAGGLFWMLLRILSRGPDRLRYFLWLSMTINLLQGAGYFLYSGVSGIGDWAAFINGLEPGWVWQLGLIVTGAVGYLLVVWFALLQMRPLVGSDRTQRARNAIGLTVLPYLAGGIQSCIAGLFNPVGMVMVAISAAAASFGGTSGLAWMAQIYHGNRIPPGRTTGPISIGRSSMWIGAGAVVAVLFVVVLGRGLH